MQTLHRKYTFVHFGGRRTTDAWSRTVAQCNPAKYCDRVTLSFTDLVSSSPLKGSMCPFENASVAVSWCMCACKISNSIIFHRRRWQRLAIVRVCSNHMRCTLNCEFMDVGKMTPCNSMLFLFQETLQIVQLPHTHTHTHRSQMKHLIYFFRSTTMFLWSALTALAIGRLYLYIILFCAQFHTK